MQNTGGGRVGGGKRFNTIYFDDLIKAGDEMLRYTLVDKKIHNIFPLK